jgi:polyphosphate kinase
MKQMKFFNRDVSWLAFNHRVLQEAQDPSVPLLERLFFLGIYSSNLDEFFKIRIASLHYIIRTGKRTQKKLDFEPKTLLKKLLDIVKKQQVLFSKIFEEDIVPNLKKNNIHILRRLELDEAQSKWVAQYFHDHMLPYVQPVLLFKNMVRPFLNNNELYLTIQMKEMKKNSDNLYYAIVKIPSDHLPRFVEVPSQSAQKSVILLDDIVRHSVSWLFPGFQILDTYSIKLTRDAELYIDDEFSGDLMAKIKQSLMKRNVGQASRMVYDLAMPPKMLTLLKGMFQVGDLEMLPEKRYHNKSDFLSFPDFGKNHLKNVPLPPLPYPPFKEAESIFKAIDQKDHLLVFPFHSYDPVIDYFRLAATDPFVTEIKVTQYRVSHSSPIMEALIEAAEAGKKVFVFIEVKARFDEEKNLKWGERLEKAGVKVHYSLPGRKVHAKMAVVTRVVKKVKTHYTYLSTGNFNEKTATIYSDFGFFSTKPAYYTDILKLFDYLEHDGLKEEIYETILVGQSNLRETLSAMVQQEISSAKKGQKASIVLKMNSLEDKEMIKQLYYASEKGVKIKLIIRGVCCLIPKVKGMSSNISAISIVDRFLEHSRVFYFHNQGQPKLYLSSADWMERNLSFRVETSFPLFDPDCIKIVKDILNLQWKDGVKARIIDATLSNRYRVNKDNPPVHSQVDTYFYIKNLTYD